MRKLMLIALAAGTAAAMAGTAVPAAAEGTECAVQYVDERGGVRDTTVEREGTVLGNFRCVGGVWQWSWDRFGWTESISTAQLRVDPAGNVSAQGFQRPERSADLTLGEMAEVSRVLHGQDGRAAFTRAVVVLDDGRERTDAEVEALLAGKDTTGARVLRTVEQPDPNSTVQDVVDETGTDEPVVVYLLGRIWDAITGAIGAVIDAVIDGVNDVIDWFDDHCDWFPPPFIPGPTITIIRCTF